LDPLLTISFDSFSSVWYWLFLGIAWSVTCHWTLGVPYDALVRAHKRGGKYAEDAEVLARIHVERYADVARSAGPYITAAAFFVIATLATFGYAYGYETAQALLVLVAPLFLVSGLNMRLAVKLAEQELDGATLRKRLVSRRFWNQVIGLSSLLVSVMAALFSFVTETVFWY